MGFNSLTLSEFFSHTIRHHFWNIIEFRPLDHHHLIRRIYGVALVAPEVLEEAEAGVEHEEALIAIEP